MIMPFTELLICVRENANRNAGIKLPNKPVSNTKPYSLNGTIFIARKTIGSETSIEILTRIEANSMGEKTSNPFLIRMYEVPQMRVSDKRINQLEKVLRDDIKLLRRQMKDY